MDDKPKLQPFNLEDFPRNDETLGSYVRRMCKERRMSLDRLAEVSGINRGTLYNVLDPTKHDTAKIPYLLKLAHALRVHHYYLMRLIWPELGAISPTSDDENKRIARLGMSALVQNDDACGFIDETIPDGTLVAAGSEFEKSWTIQNVGNTVWENRYYMHLDAPYYQMSLVDGKYPNGLLLSDYQLQPHQSLIELPVIAPSETYTLRVRYTAPNVAGRYISYWRMVDAHGRLCFKNGVGLSVSILVHSFGVAVE